MRRAPSPRLARMPGYAAPVIRSVALARWTLTLCLLGAGVVFGLSEWRLRTEHDVALRSLPAPGDAPDLREGGRLVRVLGCASCHGADLAGAVISDEPHLARIVAPNLTRRVPGYTDAELARAIRHGVGREGEGLWAMPASAFIHLGDDDLAAVIAFLRRLPARDGVEASTRFGLLGRWRVATGDLRPPAATVDHGITRLARAGDDVASRGRYLAHVACGECHGGALEGGLDGRAPPLAIGAAYTGEAFRQLLRTGRTPGDRDLYLMDDAARERFAVLTDEEIDALHAYTRVLTEGRD